MAIGLSMPQRRPLNTSSLPPALSGGGYATPTMRNYASGGYYPTGPTNTGNGQIPYYPSTPAPAPAPSNQPAFSAAAGIEDSINANNAANIQAQMDLIQQMQSAANPQQMMDLVTQMTLAQSGGHGLQTHWINQQQQAAQNAWNQQQNYLNQQVGFSQEGYGQQLSQIEQDRVNQLQSAGLSKDQALAVFRAEQATGQTAYQTGMATATQQRDYGVTRAGQEKDTTLRRAMSDAAARGATTSRGYGLDYQDTVNRHITDVQNFNKVYDIRATYETQTWQNLQNKINEGRQLTEREYNMLVEQANKEAQLEKDSAWLGHRQDYAGLQNQIAQGQNQFNLGQQGFANQQANITNAEVIRDLQWQMQMLGLQNPSNMLGLQSSWFNYQNQLANMPYNSLANIYGSVQQGLPMPYGS